MRSVTVLTSSTSTDYDNVPLWSPDGGEKIVFTRRANYTNFDILVSDLMVRIYRFSARVKGTIAHVVWTSDRRILYSTAEYGFRDEVTI